MMNKGKIALETQVSDIKENAKEELPAPGGIGMAVAVNWGLTVQIALTPILAIFGQSKLMKMPVFNSPIGNVLFLIIALLVACGFAWFGEMIRSGRNWARTIQIVISTLLSLVGIFNLFNLYYSITRGNFWPLVTEIILVIISPLIVWRMTRPSTARWFKLVTSVEARKRHGGKWMWFIILCSIIGGVLQTIAAMR
jgi:hypothetical protein